MYSSEARGSYSSMVSQYHKPSSQSTARVLRVADPDSIGSVDPDPFPEFGSGFRGAKMTHKSRKKLRNIMFWSARCSLWRAEGFFCNLDVLYGGLGIGKLQFLIKKNLFFSFVNFFKLLVIKTPVSGLDRIRIYIQVFSLKCWIRIRTYQMNTDPQPCFIQWR